MPELPEVETMVRGIRPALVGRTIQRVVVHDAKMLAGITVDGLERMMERATVQAADRRGKWVVLTMDGDRGIIVVQPRMTGGFWLVEPSRPSHIRLEFRMGEPGDCIWFCDSRRLGRIHWYPDRASAEVAFRHSHGPDALTIERADLAARLRRTDRGIKPALMDQKILAGIGNIYADEILFEARVHPERPASSLGRAEVARIHAAIPVVLEQTIAAQGSSFDQHYRTVLGSKGGFLKQNAMYGRGGLDCPGGCGGAVLKTRIAGLIGRPTHFCPVCQPKTGRGPAARARRATTRPTGGKPAAGGG